MRAILFKTKRKAWKISKWFYYGNFPVFLFLIIGAVLITAISLMEISFPLAYLLACLLFVASVFYYTVYFLIYQRLIDAYTDKEYYLKVYSFWGIIFFNIIAICCFAFFAFTTDILLNNRNLFHSFSYENTVIYFFTQIIDSATFSLLGSFGIELYKPEAGVRISDSCKNLACGLNLNSFNISRLDIVASSYIYSVSLIIDLAFWSSVFAEIIGWLEAKQKVDKIIRDDKLEPEPLSANDIKRNKELIRRINFKDINIEEQASKVVFLLKESNTKETKDVYLRIMQESFFDAQVFNSCLDYFKRNPDRRFEQVCRKIKHHKKRKLIEEFQNRQPQKQPWRGRGKRPSS